MAEFQAYSCDALTGAVIDRIPASAFSYERMLSSGGGGSVTIPIDGTYTKAELKALVTPWSRIIVLERDGVVLYAGYSLGLSYQRGASSVTVKLADLWTMLDRRGAWNHNAPNMEVWQTTVSGRLGVQASSALSRGRSGPALPAMAIPVTASSGSSGVSVSRTYYGYNVETVGDVFTDLLAEGLDVYFRPRWLSGNVNWQMFCDPGWSSGTTREFSATSELSPVTEFSESQDAARVTNNARFIGEGSEVDMLVRSFRNTDSSYPLLDRATSMKNISDTSQLTALAIKDLDAYGEPTSQWSFDVTADMEVDVGDTVRMHFEGDAWIGDAWYARRVVGIKGDMSETKTVIVQPTGGA